MAMDFQMEALALKESSRKAEMDLQQQLSSAREELQLTSQNTEVMREALQVNCLLSLRLLIPSTKNCVSALAKPYHACLALHYHHSSYFSTEEIA